MIDAPVAKRMRQRQWDGAPLTCTAVRDEAPSVKTFCLAPTDGSRIKFHAGQNLTIAWPMDGETLTRTFTIASPPTLTGHVELTVKAHHGGRVTPDLHRRLAPGCEVRAYGPGGQFGLAFTPSDRILMVSGGSGVTPMMSMLRLIRDRRYTSDVCLIHSASQPGDLMFTDELRAIAARCPNVSVTLLPSSVPRGEGWIGPRGRLSRRLLHALVPDAKHRVAFLCGPPAFRAAVRRALAAEGVDPFAIREESFVSEPPAPPPLAATGETVIITLARSGRQIEAAADRTIYETLRRSGVVVPTGCRTGICGTCRIASVSGQVTMMHQGGLSPAQEKAGQILACCSYPSGPLALDL